MNLVNLASFGINSSVVALMATIGYAEVNEYRNEKALEAFQEQHQCIAMNMYHEARSDSKLGMKAVGFVTLNRAYDDRYPDTPCDVVYQARLDGNGNPRRNQCQFSWFCDGKSDKPKDEVMWKVAQGIAYQVMEDYGKVEDPTDGAIMYHASYVSPYWKKSYERTVRIDSHIFYK